MPHWLYFFGFPSRVRAVAYSDAASTMLVKVPRIASDWAWQHCNGALLVKYLAHSRTKILTDVLGMLVSSIRLCNSVAVGVECACFTGFVPGDANLK